MHSFWNRVNLNGPTAANAVGPCWVWLGLKDKNGYGRLVWKGKAYQAHRLAWLLAHGALPTDTRIHVLHKCDRPSCCNPAHLFLGTEKDNAQDRNSKGRAFPIRPWLRALTKTDADCIRNKKSAGASFRQLSKEYGVAVCCIQNIVTNKTYTEV